MTKKNIIIIIVILIILIVGFFLFFRPDKHRLKVDLKGIESLTINMPFESGLEELELDSFDLGIGLSSDFFSDIPVNTDLGDETFELGDPNISVETLPIQSGTPPADWQSDQATCDKFKLAPSCALVPAEYREICQQCSKNKK